ncbi:DGF-1-like protein, putative, partial [Bodo saltans]
MQPRAGGTTAQVLVTNVTLLNGAVLYIVGSAGGPSYVHPGLVVNVSGVSMLNGALVLARSLPMGCTLLVEDINAISTTALAPVSPPFITSDPVRQGASLYFLGFAATDNASCLLRRIDISTNITTSSSVIVLGTLLVSRNSSMTLHDWTQTCSSQACVSTGGDTNTIEVRLSSMLFVDHWSTSSTASIFSMYSLVLANSSLFVIRDVSAETPTLLLLNSGVSSQIGDASSLMLLDISMTAFTPAIITSATSVASLVHAGTGLALTGQSTLMIRNTGSRSAPAAVNLGASGSVSSSSVVLVCNRFGRLMQNASLGGNYVLLNGAAVAAAYVTVSPCNSNATCGDVNASCFAPATSSVAHSGGSATAPSAQTIGASSCTCICSTNSIPYGELCLLRPLWYLGRIDIPILNQDVRTYTRSNGLIAATRVFINTDFSGEADVVMFTNMTFIGPGRFTIDIVSHAYGALGTNSSLRPLVVNLTDITLFNTSLSFLCSPMPLPNGRPLQLNIMRLQATESYIHFAGTPPPYSTISIVSSSTLITGASQSVMDALQTTIAPSLTTNVGATNAAILFDAFGLVSGSSFTLQDYVAELPLGENAAIASRNDLWISRASQFTISTNLHITQHTLLSTQSAILVEGSNSMLLVQNHTHRPSGSGSIIRSLAVSVISSGYVVLRYVAGTTTNLIAVVPNGNLTVGDASLPGNSGTVLITASMAQGGLISAGAVVATAGSEVSFVGNRAGSDYLTLQRGWSLQAGAAVYMGCNSVGGTPYITRNQYSALTVGAVLTSLVCTGCAKDNRCLIGMNTSSGSLLLSVSACQCSCIDYNASAIGCATVKTPSVTQSVSMSQSSTVSLSDSYIAPTSSLTASAVPTDTRSPTMSVTESGSITGTTTSSRSSSQTSSTSTTVSLSRGSRTTSISLSLTQTTSTSSSLSVSPSDSRHVSASATASPSRTFSRSMTTSLTVTRSHSGDTASRTVRGWSISESQSLTSSLSVSLSATLSLTSSPTFSLSEGTLSGSDTHVVTGSPTNSDSSSNEHSLTATRSNSATLSDSLSPVWPVALGVTTVTGSTATVRYLYDGLVWFNASTTASFTVWPRQLDGRDMPAGFYRHPQPPFNVSMMNSTAPVPFVASVGAECSLSLPCAISVAPSYDRFTPVELRVDYGTPAVPTLSTTAVFAYANQAPDRLQIVTDTVLTVCGGAPLPEVYLRVVDTDGYPYTASTHVPVNLTIAGGWSNFSEAYVVAGQLGPATTMAVLPAALNGTGALSLTATAAGLGNANLTFTVVQCPRVLQGSTGSQRELHRVVTSTHGSLPATVLFYAPVSSIPRTLYC